MSAFLRFDDGVIRQTTNIYFPDCVICLDPTLSRAVNIYENMKDGGTLVLATKKDLEALDLPGSNHDWAQAGSAATQQTLRSRAHSQLLWTKNMLGPWMWHHARGKSSGDGREPKRPTLQTVFG